MIVFCYSSSNRLRQPPCSWRAAPLKRGERRGHEAFCSAHTYVLTFRPPWRLSCSEPRHPGHSATAVAWRPVHAFLDLRAGTGPPPNSSSQLCNGRCSLAGYVLARSWHAAEALDVTSRTSETFFLLPLSFTLTISELTISCSHLKCTDLRHCPVHPC